MPEFDSVKDSGVRQEFATGSRRDVQTGKGRWDLMPWLMLKRLARHYENGAVKYGDNNWLKGQPTSRYMSSALNHIVSYMLGMRDEDHLTAAIWNLSAAVTNEELVERGIYDSSLHDVGNFLQKDLFDDFIYGHQEPAAGQFDFAAALASLQTLAFPQDNRKEATYCGDQATGPMYGPGRWKK